MNTRSRLFKRFLAFLCVALILTCTLALFLPHRHAHEIEENCEACSVIDQWQNLLLAIMLLPTFAHAAFCLVHSFCAYSYKAPADLATPVGQKVKLSN